MTTPKREAPTGGAFVVYSRMLLRTPTEQEKA